MRGRMRALGAPGAALTAFLLIACVLSAGTAPTSGGWIARIANSSDTAATAPYFTCAASTGADRASALFAWPLTETTGTAAADASGHGNAGTYQGTLATAAVTGSGGCPRDSGTAYALNGTSSFVDLATQQTNPTTFSLEVWFRTTTASGRLLGFGSAATGASASYDRQLYLSTAGKLVFGVYPSAYKTLTAPAVVTDGLWHHVVVTFSASAGTVVYLDGRSVASDATMTTAQTYNGYWRLGYDAQGSWPGAGANGYFTGSMRFAAVYSTALTASQVAQHATSGT